MQDLDDPEKIKELDKENMSSSIEKLGDQIISAWEGAGKLDLSSYSEIENVVFTAMGGSGLGADFVRSVFEINRPMQIVHEYKLPSFVNEKTLVIAASYSGTTEETISTLHDAIEKKAKVVVFATGQKLAEIAKEKNVPYYLFDTSHNPSGQPRMGNGFTIGATLAILAKLGLVEISGEEVAGFSEIVKRTNDSFKLEVETEQNEAKKFAQELVGKITVVVSAEFLSGVAHIFTNQINENAKNFATYFLISEANHHLLEGTKFPENLGEKIKFVFLESRNMFERIKKRLDVTRGVLEKASVTYSAKEFSGESRIEDAFSALVFCSWTNFYMALVEGIDPSPIPSVDFFKEKLSQ